MREIAAGQITQAVKGLAMGAAYHLGEDVVKALEKGLEQETSPSGQDVLSQLLQNARIADEGKFPMCQDTGFAVVFVELGQGVHVAGGEHGLLPVNYLRSSLILGPKAVADLGDIANVQPIPIAVDQQTGQ